MIKKISAIFILILMFICMTVPAFAISVTEYNSLTPAEQKNYKAVTTNGVTTYEPKSSTINDINIRMDNGSVVLEGFVKGDQSSTWTDIFTKYKTFIAGVSGIAAITMIVFFILNFMKLGASSGNPQARTQALMGVLWTGIASGLLGAVSIFFGFFYSILL